MTWCVQHPSIGNRSTLAGRYLARTRWRLAAGYGLLLAIVLFAAVAATYTAARVHETAQIHDQLASAARKKLYDPDLLSILHHPPQLKDEEEAVRTFIMSSDGVVRDADAVAAHPPDPNALTSVLHGTGPTFTTIGSPVNVLSVYTVPIHRHGTVVGAVQTVTAEMPYHVVLQYLLLVSLITGGVGLLLAVILGLLMADWGLRPVRAAITSQQALAQSAAHELRTPLTLMRTAAELALRSGRLEEMRDALTTTVRQTEHLDGVVGDLRLLAEGDIGRLLVDVAPVDLVALAREVYDEVRPAAEEAGIRLDLHTPSTLVAPADGQRPASARPDPHGQCRPLYPDEWPHRYRPESPASNGRADRHRHRTGDRAEAPTPHL